VGVAGGKFKSRDTLVDACSRLASDRGSSPRASTSEGILSGFPQRPDGAANLADPAGRFCMGGCG
jgi:hypothetical protein